jgi:hypothetical protein
MIQSVAKWDDETSEISSPSSVDSDPWVPESSNKARDAVLFSESAEDQSISRCRVRLDDGIRKSNDSDDADVVVSSGFDDHFSGFAPLPDRGDYLNKLGKLKHCFTSITSQTIFPISIFSSDFNLVTNHSTFFRSVHCTVAFSFQITSFLFWPCFFLLSLL